MSQREGNIEEKTEVINDSGKNSSSAIKRPPVQDLGQSVLRRFKRLDGEEIEMTKQIQSIAAGIVTPYKNNSDSSRMRELLKDPE